MKRKLLRILFYCLCLLLLFLITNNYTFWFGYDLGNSDMLNFIRAMGKGAL
jgi:hypothetical protein